MRSCVVCLCCILLLSLTACAKKNPDKPELAALQKPAEQGDARAQRVLELLQKPAKQGDAKAQSMLGTLYAFGRGVPQDDSKALYWLQKSAKQGYAEAQFQLGVRYYFGVQKDYAKAAHWFQKAAEQGHAFAQNNLGVMHEKGLGVPQDDAKALQWWEKAALQGQRMAQYNLGVMYASGHGVPIDPKAAQWYQKAADSAAVDEGVIIDRSKPGVVIVRNPPGTGLAGVSRALQRSLDITKNEKVKASVQIDQSAVNEILGGVSQGARADNKRVSEKLVQMMEAISPQAAESLRRMEAFAEKLRGPIQPDAPELRQE